MENNIKYSTESFTFIEIKEKKYASFIGWCYTPDDATIQYEVYFDDKRIENIELDYPDRQDVLQRYHLDFKNGHIGYKILVPYEVRPKKIQVYAKAKDETVCLKEWSQDRINKAVRAEEIRYSVDQFNFNEEKREYTCSGWAYAFDKSELKYEIKDTNGKNVDIQFKTKGRFDVVQYDLLNPGIIDCGFEIKFKGDKKKKYVLKISSKNGEVEKKLASISTRKKLGKIKIFLQHISPSKIKYGLYILKHDGLKEFIKRLIHGSNKWIKYDEWFQKTKVTEEELEKQKNVKFEFNPVISIIVATFNTKESYLQEMIDSVRNQSYPNWQLCIGDGSTNDSVEKYVQANYGNDSRIIFKKLEKNYGISGNMNGALELVTGDYVGLFDHDDLLTPDCLYEIVSSMQKVHHDCVYTDEDKLNDKTKYFEDPHFKPDFSIDLLRSHNYITHFFVVNMDIVRKVGGMRSEYDGSQDHDFIFRCVEQAKSVHHIPKILYHWRMHPLSTAMDPESKMYCYTAGKKAIESHLERVGIEGTVEMLPKPLYGMYHVKYKVHGNPLVSVLIPNMNNKDLLKGCIDSLMNTNTYKNIEIVIVENNSTEQEIFDYYKEIQEKYANIKVITYKGDFNYSKINNYGVKYTSGDYILFLNNDTKMKKPDSLEDMLGVCMREDVGAVGAKLLYEDNTVQHDGVVIGYKGYAAHAFSLIGEEDFGYMGRPRVSWDVSAVTAACLLTKRSIFNQVGGFDEQFKVACNDVDFCLKIRSLNKWIVEDNFSIWYHYESKTRGLEDTPEKLERFNQETKKFQAKWPEILKNGDPFHNINFDLDKGPFTYPE